MTTRGRLSILFAGVLVFVGVALWTPPVAEAAPAKNPTPLTDLFAQTFAPGTGGVERLCATSSLGIPVHCVEYTTTQPSGDPAAYATTFAHWVFCKGACNARTMRHEMVHVGQFEYYGDRFGPLYLAEAAQHGDGCANRFEKPAYQANGDC
jgi:hypothetical protein